MKRVLSNVLLVALAIVTLSGCTLLGGTKKVTKIELNTGFVKTVYEVGESFTSEGLIVTAIYDGLTEEDVTEDATIDSSLFNKEETGSYTIKVTYKNKHAYYSVTVNDLEMKSIGVNTDQVKLVYLTGQTLSLTGLVVFANYANDAIEVLNQSDYTINSEQFNNTQPGTYTITVSHDELTTSFEVTVLNAENLNHELIRAIEQAHLNKYKQTKTIGVFGFTSYYDEDEQDYILLCTQDFFKVETNKFLTYYSQFYLNEALVGPTLFSSGFDGMTEAVFDGSETYDFAALNDGINKATSLQALIELLNDISFLPGYTIEIFGAMYQLPLILDYYNNMSQSLEIVFNSTRSEFTINIPLNMFDADETMIMKLNFDAETLLIKSDAFVNPEDANDYARRYVSFGN